MQIHDRKGKLFEDSVHGHIIIPYLYCAKIIDTTLFQRLRRIEQTSVRPIFPSARHDRFIHSLGVYHMGNKIFTNIYTNLQRQNDSEVFNIVKNLKLTTHLKVKENEKDGFWQSLKETYEIACLLHDCGHAPFSHTFEDYYYNRITEEEGSRIDTIPILRDLVNEYTDCVNQIPSIKQQTKKDLVCEFKFDLLNAQPKPHELVSAWLVLHKEGFRNIILDNFYADPLIIARMIIGCKYNDYDNNDNIYETQNKNKHILNCFISLLNGHEIDADRLDYAARDKWATGINTTTINVDRLLHSIEIAKLEENKFVICFNKKALPELQGLSDIKNYTNFWILNHHKVLYYDRLLIKAVEKLALLFDSKESIERYLEAKKQNPDYSLECDAHENDSLYKFFDYNNLLKTILFTIEMDDKIYYEDLYLMSDDDIVHLLKKYFCIDRNFSSPHLKKLFERTNYAKEWFARQQYLRPVWKSFAEFNIKYLKFHTELNNVNSLLDKITKNPPKSREDISAYKNLFNKGTVVLKWIENIEKNNIDDWNLFINDQIKELVKYQVYFKEGLEKDFEDIMIEILKDIKKDFDIKPDTFKMIPVENLVIKEIRPNSIFIKMEENIICYRELGLPQRNQQDRYCFFYIFAPIIYDKDSHKEVPDDIYKEFYISKFQQKIGQIKYNP
jgi:HD superfamily phosphohydrolase